jgi:uncharacterized membrane protein YheB (UPF0754 family)
MNFDELLTDLQTNWYIYVAMPFAMALIGYVTKLVAIEMMFRPLEFRGLRAPFLGWQGIVPRRAAKMAGIAVDLMTSRLISPQEVFERLDPDRVAREVEEPLIEAMEQITREVAAQYQPGLWESMPEAARRLVIKRIQGEAPRMARSIMTDIRKNIDQVFDLKHMVVTNLVRDKALLNRVFRDVGSEEFKFIARSGIYFGFAIGLVQVVVWALTHNPWVLPLFGAFTGYFTDWLALKMIFRPIDEKRYFYFFRWQGLFQRRRKEIAKQYGALIAEEILTPRAIIEVILTGPSSDRLYAMVQREVQRVFDHQTGFARPLVVMAVGSRTYQAMKESVAQHVVANLPETLGHIESYAEDAMDIKNTLETKMQQLTKTEFEGLLRPAFQQDEWILILVGAALGAFMGELEVLLLVH